LRTGRVDDGHPIGLVNRRRPVRVGFGGALWRLFGLLAGQGRQALAALVGLERQALARVPAVEGLALLAVKFLARCAAT
jgi:hypothetical protein